MLLLFTECKEHPNVEYSDVDVGNMPSHLAMQFVERVKTEIHQRRIPSATGGGTNVIDSSYNPLSINEDYFPNS